MTSFSDQMTTFYKNDNLNLQEIFTKNWAENKNWPQNWARKLAKRRGSVSSSFVSINPQHQNHDDKQQRQNRNLNHHKSSPPPNS
jgi:hypothetical protein